MWLFINFSISVTSNNEQPLPTYDLTLPFLLYLIHGVVQCSTHAYLMETKFSIICFEYWALLHWSIESSQEPIHRSSNSIVITHILLGMQLTPHVSKKKSWHSCKILSLTNVSKSVVNVVDINSIFKKHKHPIMML